MVNGTSLVITAVVSFGVTAILGFWLIPFLKKLKYGQTILDIGPRWHKSKENTPTMGGFMFIIGIVSAAILGFISNSAGKN
ncbi:MAG: phospho-N-acetylmuramoyl-pentapeptide-transferase, partial [Oscillospiraceae bacterium]